MNTLKNVDGPNYDNAVIGLIKTSGSLEELETNLKAEGIEFPNYKDYFSFIKTEWEKHKQPVLNEIYESPAPEINDLPSKTIDLKGRKIILHGISHGRKPFPKPNNVVKKYIEERMSDYSKESDGCYVEQKFSSMFENSGDFKEIDDISTVVHEKSEEMPLVFALGFGLIPAPALLTEIINPMKKENRNTLMGRKLAVAALGEIGCQKKCFDFISEMKLPQPLDFEMGYIKNRNSPLYPMLFPDSGKRSMYTAEKLSYKAKISKNRKAIHYVGGINHISEIEYFIQNPPYHFDGFENLEKYRRKLLKRGGRKII